MKIQLKLIFIYFVLNLINCQNIREHAAELRAVKGQFFVHMLHSAYFFPQTVDVKWSASTRGRPSLPQWMHLIPSRHPTRIDSFQSSEQSFSVVTNDDPRYSGTTRQIAEIYLTNVNAEELLWGVGRDDKIKNLERAIHSTFKGKHVNPYIFNILPGTENALDLLRQFQGNIRTGAIIQIGTQLSFHPNVQLFARGMHSNTEFCSLNQNIPMDRHFYPEFRVDWCKFYLKNVTIPADLEQYLRKKVKDGKNLRTEENNEEGSILGIKTANTSGYKIFKTENEHLPAPPIYYIWESVLVFPLLAVFCLLCILCLSFIFFGRREGQHWRDYKTPKNQLEQYLNLRESQHHLREMSQQRQLLASMSHSGREKSDMSIGTFLRPIKDEEKGSSQISSKPDSTTERVSSYPTSSIGKQTVAEAARANGSALHLYRHPIIDSDGDEIDEEGIRGNQENRWINNQRW
uniref:Uncharacterized protein n=2 Tax=Meloidogyne enterolobii TaxID=390850 RepID=A0A6V7TW99_MELEN|nr:unnamed protein product [Meloidogyne enterolobii]